MREIPSKFEALVGETLVAISGCAKGSNLVEFVTKSGRVFRMYHEQDCCEDVRVEDVVGSPFALLHSPMLFAREDSNDTEPEPYEFASSFLWTFYNLGTAKAVLTIRWLGESNGYYSERVKFVEVRP